MGLLDEIKKLTKPYSGDEYDEFGDEMADSPAETRIPVSESSRKYPPERASAGAAERGYERPERRANPFSDPERTPVAPRRDKVVNLGTAAPVQVVLVKPERFETAAEIADHLRDRRPVVMNLEQAPKDTARRLIDFLSGVAYALDGRIKKIATNTYILTPYNVDILGDLIDEIESSGLYQ